MPSRHWWISVLQLDADYRAFLQAIEFRATEEENARGELDGDALVRGWNHAIKTYGPAALGRADRFYLLCVLLHRKDMFKPFFYARCREVEANTDGFLDLWAREHGKSSIITFAGSIQEILLDPEITIGVFSHTRPDAAKFLAQIKGELETNEELQQLYPDILYATPHKDSPLWSVEKGIVVRRRANPREATVEAHGVVETQPVGSHFRLMIFDDLVTPASVSTPEQVKKTTMMHALADNLGARGPDGLKRKWHIGTRYSFRDTYQDLLDRKSLKPRIYPATDDGTRDGNPVLLTPEAWAIVKRDQPTNVLAAQMLQNPAAGNEALFKKEWLRFLDIRPATLTVGIMCDPASSRKKGSDDTVIHVWGMDAARNRWLLDGYHHKMGLTERWQRIRDLHKKWVETPGVQIIKVGYERYGSTSDLEYFTERMEIERYPFEIVELAWPLEGPGSKYDRIQRLEPDFRQGKIYLAATSQVESANQAAMRAQAQAFRIFTPTRRMDHEGNAYGLNKKLLDEYLVYPYSAHDDGLDTASRWNDMDMHPPQIIDQRDLEPEYFADGI
jgi:phage terminase large subunit-like protein